MHRVLSPNESMKIENLERAIFLFASHSLPSMAAVMDLWATIRQLVFSLNGLRLIYVEALLLISELAKRCDAKTASIAHCIRLLIKKWDLSISFHALFQCILHNIMSVRCFCVVFNSVFATTNSPNINSYFFRGEWKNVEAEKNRTTIWCCSLPIKRRIVLCARFIVAI